MRIGVNDPAIGDDLVGVLTGHDDQVITTASSSDLPDNTALQESAYGEDGKARMRLLREAALRALI